MSFTSQQLDQIRQQIVKSAGRPKSITVDGETFVQHDLTALLEAYRLAQSATVKKNSGIVFRKIVSPGAQ